ncbi:MAG: hypothetical protein ACRBFS_07560 [Aureispira sp.]
MEKKKVAFYLIKALSHADRLTFKQRIKCGKTAKTAERHEKVFAYLDKATSIEEIERIDSRKLASSLKLSSSKKLTPLYGELIDDLKQYLILTELKEQELQQELLLQKALCRREESVYIEELHQSIRDTINSTSDPTPQQYQQYASFYRSLYLHPNTNTHKEETLLYLNRSEVNLDTFYWIEKLRLLVEKANRATSFPKENYLIEELPALPDLTQYTYNDDGHILSLYATVYKLALAPFQKRDLKEVLDLLNQHSSGIPKDDKELIFNYLVNITNYYIPTSQTDLNMYDVYQVYKIAFTNHWLVQNDGFIYFEDFINMLYLAFTNKDTELLEKIDADYTEYIQTTYAPHVSMLSKAYNFFLHQRWEAVLKAFSDHDLPDREHRIHFIIQRNTLEIKSLFEAFKQQKIELGDIPSYLEKHSRFIQRKSSVYSNQGKIRNLNFIKLLKPLYNYLCQRITFNFDKKEAKKQMIAWLEEVSSTSANTIDLPWLKSIGESLLQELEWNVEQRPSP